MNTVMKKNILMKNRIITFLLVFVSFSFLFSQKQKILFATQYGNTTHKNITDKFKLDSVIIFYQNEFVKGDNTNFDCWKLKKAIEKRIPSTSQKGYAVLDWEGTASAIVYTHIPASDKDFKNTVQNFVDAIKYAKKIRPNIMWSYYNFPPIYYGQVNIQHDEIIKNKVMPVLKVIDFLAPSIYFMDTEKEVSPPFSYNYAKSNTEMAIKYGLLLNKPVFPFIWQRYTDHSKSSTFGLVDLDYFENFIAQILTSTYKSKKVDGIIWWDAEDYVFNNQKLFKGTQTEYKSIKNFENYKFMNTSYYYNRIMKSLNK